MYNAHNAAHGELPGVASRDEPPAAPCSDRAGLSLPTTVAPRREVSLLVTRREMPLHPDARRGRNDTLRDRMRVLHVVAPAGFGGLERVVQTLAAAQTTRGDDVHVAALVSPADGQDARLFCTPLRGSGIDVHEITLPARAYRRERDAIAELGRRLDTEIVHTHGYRPDVVVGGVARRIGAAAISTAHGFTGGGGRNRLYEWLERRALRRFDAVVAVSRPLANRLARSGIAKSRIHTIVNIWTPFAPPEDRVTARQTLGVPHDVFLIGWVGRLSREKGLDVLLSALPGVADLPLHLAVVGEGPERHALEAYAQAKGLSPRVTWCGAVPDAARLFAAFDLFVLSSRTEGTPMVLFEAMAAGVPIVAPYVGGVPDMLTSREAALVPPGSADGFAAAIRYAVQQQAVVAARAILARERLDREANAGSWAESYSRVYEAARVVAAKR
jgi:glycosyltransferase involved in cell wall biosynthesis